MDGFEAEPSVLMSLSALESQMLDFLAQLVATRSENPPGDERGMAELLRNELNRLGLFEIKVIAKDPRRPNLICSVTGDIPRPSSSLLYCGHMDTKPVGDARQWRSDPFVPTIRDGRMYGLGACDMKAALAAMVYAAGAINAVRESLSGTLTLVFCADEEAGGEFGAAYLTKRGLIHADAAIVCEPAGIDADWEYVYVASRGESCFRIRVSGTQMHSSLSDRGPSTNANIRAAELILRMTRYLNFGDCKKSVNYGDVTFTPAVLLEGGVYFGILPSSAEFACEVRVPPGITQKDISQAVDSFLADERRRDPDLRVEWWFEPGQLGWIAPQSIREGHPVIRSIGEAAHEVLGRAVPYGIFPAWTDARFFHSAGIPTVPAFGPGLLTEAHMPNESVDLSAVISASRIYALTAFKYFTGP